MSARLERFAIVGTAPSWAKTPWTDSGLHIRSLNDAYRIKGFVRADSWLDMHPLDRFIHPPTQDAPLFAHQVPAGYYVRPVDHLKWLGEQAATLPVWLHPDYLTQHPAAAAWPHARAFPRADIEAAFGRYFTSSPAWMLAHAILQGAKEIHIYGIHLATEHEYIEQRPNFEFLCGRVLGMGKLTVTEADGMRRFETADGMIVLPSASPILASNFQYAFQTRPRASLEPLRWDLHRFSIKRNRALDALVRAKPWTPRGALRQDLARYDALLADTQDQMQRMDAAQQGR